MAVQANWDTLPGVAPRKGVIRKVFSGKNSMMTLNEIKAGTTPNLHSHPHEQLTYILSGEAEFVLGKEVLRLKAGDLLLVPPNVPHSLKVIGNETVLNMDVFSPVREDYL
jgi:quercetin dioxygenase-like cupin family protein